MTADPPSFVADVAAQVVAWHNRHPLARRITRKDVQGVGIVVLPFARDGQRPWHAAQPKRSLLALMFPPRQRRQLWPVFSEDVLPEVGPRALADFARRHGHADRPGPEGLPERAAAFDRDLLDGAGSGEFPPERLNRYLVTAAIDLGPNRPRLMLGQGRRPAVLGQRLWSLPRLAALGGGALLALVVSAAGLWLKAMPQRGGPAAAHGAAATASKAAPAASAASPAAKAASVLAGASAMPASAAPAPAQAPAPAPTPAPAPAPAATVPAPTPPPPTAAASAPRAPVPPAPAASASPAPSAALPVQVMSPASAPAPAAAPPKPAPAASAAPAPGPAPAPAQTAAPASAATAARPAPAPRDEPPLPEVQQASAPLVPRLKPDLAGAARAEIQRSGASAPRPAGAGTPGGPRAAASQATPAVTQFYALVTRPVRSRAEAEALLRRLRAETDRINHPTASQTGLQETREGWRVTWWPFTNPRQAENARVALARRIELEVVGF